jgi:hypothetical protein
MFIIIIVIISIYIISVYYYYCYSYSIHLHHYRYFPFHEGKGLTLEDGPAPPPPEKVYAEGPYLAQKMNAETEIREKYWKICYLIHLCETHLSPQHWTVGWLHEVAMELFASNMYSLSLFPNPTRTLVKHGIPLISYVSSVTKFV